MVSLTQADPVCLQSIHAAGCSFSSNAFTDQAVNISVRIDDPDLFVLGRKHESARPATQYSGQTNSAPLHCLPRLRTASGLARP